MTQIKCAVFKRATYAHSKRHNWNKLCSTFDPRDPNTKISNLGKSISREQPQVEKCNTIQGVNGTMLQTDRKAANILGKQYQKISNLDYSKVHMALSKEDLVTLFMVAVVLPIKEILY
ncbi:hypothetical protein TNCV_343681 [Trichonephila clavipes]|nr:hypothetical protein TNCV_343681 [Trichonephila clavipes]